MTTVSEIFDILADARVSFFLPWRGWRGPFCHMSCIARYLSETSEVPTRVAFVSAESLKPYRTSKTATLNISWGIVKAKFNSGDDFVQVGRDICNALNNAGIKTSWDGQGHTNILAHDIEWDHGVHNYLLSIDRGVDGDDFVADF